MSVLDSKSDLRDTGVRRANSEKSQTVIRIDPNCRLIPQLSADAFRNIQGVYEVQVDSACKTIRIIFDGLQETVGRLADYLCSCGQKPRCGAKKPCNRSSRFDFEQSAVEEAGILEAVSFR
jgi:hypothetical protein